MEFSKKNIKNVGLWPQGTYDAEILKVTEHIETQEDGTETIYWMFHFNIIQRNKYRPFIYCLKYSEDANSEFAYVMADLHQLMGKTPAEKIMMQELTHLCVSVVFGYDIEIGRPKLKEAILKNRIDSIGRSKHLLVWFTTWDNERANK